MMLSIAAETSTSQLDGPGFMTSGRTFWDDVVGGDTHAPALGTREASQRFFSNKDRAIRASWNPAVHSRPTTLSATEFAHRLRAPGPERERLTGLTRDRDAETHFLANPVERAAPSYGGQRVQQQEPSPARPRLNWENARHSETGSPDWAARDQLERSSPTLGETLSRQAREAHAADERGDPGARGSGGGSSPPDWQDLPTPTMTPSARSSRGSTRGGEAGAVGGRGRRQTRARSAARISAGMVRFPSRLPLPPLTASLSCGRTWWVRVRVEIPG
jgi:hypothetical protein